eukprot:5268392-Prymnesium_polylepis.1
MVLTVIPSTAPRRMRLSPACANSSLWPASTTGPKPLGLSGASSECASRESCRATAASSCSNARRAPARLRCTTVVFVLEAMIRY